MCQFTAPTVALSLFVSISLPTVAAPVAKGDVRYAEIVVTGQKKSKDTQPLAKTKKDKADKQNAIGGGYEGHDYPDVVGAKQRKDSKKNDSKK